MTLPKLTKASLDKVTSFFNPLVWGAAINPKLITDGIRKLAEHVQPGIFIADNMFTWGRNNSMFDDLPFVQAWESNVETESDKMIIWRRYILVCAAYHCVQLDGDFVECGAYTGVGIKTVADYLGGRKFPKTFWGYDLFEHPKDALHHVMPAHGPGLFERVTAKFREYPQVRIIRGNIPDVFEGQSPERISYLHIDLNQAPAEIAALDALFHRIVPGGMVILDDYEWAMAYRGQKLAEDPWFESRNYRVMPLPTGQGLVIKR